MKVLQICAYCASYPGNFIKSLLYLDKKLKQQGHETIFAFPEPARNLNWCKELEKEHVVYFLPLAKARILPKTYHTISKILADNKEIGMIHSHFELYDLPVAMVAPKNVKVFWHLHDPVYFKNNLRGKLFKLQYRRFGKRVRLLSVADYYRNYIVSLGFPYENTNVVLNGIDTERIKYDRVCSQTNDYQYDFLTFGWDFFRKGDDVIIDACRSMNEEKIKFKVLIVGNMNTKQAIQDYCGGVLPDNIEFRQETNDINELFAQSKVFIQASRKETFSYAVCEAAYAGLPVISSDIGGLEWAKELPTVSFFESENSIALAEKMKNSLVPIPSIDDLEKTKRIIQEKYTVDAWAKNILLCYGLV